MSPKSKIQSPEIIRGESLEYLRSLASDSIQCCVTSPPYWGLRDYGVRGQLGLEKSPEEYVERLLDIFAEVHRVLKPDGTLWLNLGDCYAGGGNYRGTHSLETLAPKQRSNRGARGVSQILGAAGKNFGLAQKQLVGMPWRVAFALQSAGWWLRTEIIWHKKNPMPESVTDRPTRAHEYIFLLTKSARYYYDSEAIKEPASENTLKRLSQATLYSQPGGSKAEAYAQNFPGKKHRDRKPVEIIQSIARQNGFQPNGEGRNSRMFVNQDPDHSSSRKLRFTNRRALAMGRKPSGNESKLSANQGLRGITRNKRTVWTIATAPYRGAHFATFPAKLIEPCILAGCPPGGIVLDPFAGSGTVGKVALQHGRHAVLIELNPAYIPLIRERCAELQHS